MNNFDVKKAIFTKGGGRGLEMTLDFLEMVSESASSESDS